MTDEFEMASRMVAFADDRIERRNSIRDRSKWLYRTFLGRKWLDWRVDRAVKAQKAAWDRWSAAWKDN